MYTYIALTFLNIYVHMYIYIHVYTYAHMYEILENQLATQFTMYNHCGAET